MTQRETAAAVCEDLLRRERAYNVEHKIWPSVNRIIDRMLERGAELNPVYEELCTQLEPKAVDRFLSLIYDVGAVWHPDYLRTAREGRRRQAELRSEIFELATELSARLRERNELGQSSGFQNNAAYHVVDLIERASESNGRFYLHLRTPLSALRHQFDLKYWPSVAGVVDGDRGRCA